jgi:hypothetical protein
VYEIRVMGIFKDKRNEMTGVWTKLHNEELPNLNSSQSIIKMMESMRMRRARHVACMGRRGMHT